MPAKKPAAKAVVPKKAAPKAAPAKVAAPKKAAPKAVPAKVAAPKKAAPKAAPAKAPAPKKAAPKAAPAKVAAPKKAKPVKIAFERFSPASRSVALVGDFNGWVPDATPLVRDTEGVWRTVLELVPGTYEYKFVYDGLSYEVDPDREQVWGPFGANNVVVVG